MMVFRAAWNLILLPLWPLWLLARLLFRPGGDYVLVKVRSDLSELPARVPPLARFLPRLGLARKASTSLQTLRDVARYAKDDDRIRGIAFVLPPDLSCGWAKARALREVLSSVRSSSPDGAGGGGGTEVACFLPEGGGNKEMYVASAADKVFLTPMATIEAKGLGATRRYLKGLLANVGVEWRPFSRREYKTADEPLHRDSMSPEEREQTTALLRSLDGELVSALSERPRLDEGRVRSAFEKAFFRGADAVGAGFADDVGYEDDLPWLLRDGRDNPAKFVRYGQYHAFRKARFFCPLVRRRYVAVVDVKGALIEWSNAFGGPGQHQREHITAALRQALADDRAVGVLLHVNCPGGHPLPTDLIHREVSRAKDKKPVVAYFDDVAASGGYYLSAPSHAIVAQPTSTVGSIGVTVPHVLAKDLLERVGITTEVVSVGAPRVDFLDPSREMTDDERAALDEELDAYYGEFVNIVSAGRGMSVEDVEDSARGRIWTGADAMSRGLVDRLGGFEDAAALVRERAGFASVWPGEMPALRIVPKELDDLPPPERPKHSGAYTPPSQPSVQAMLSALSPELAELAPLLGQRSRVLFYASGLPEIH